MNFDEYRDKVDESIKYLDYETAIFFAQVLAETTDLDSDWVLYLNSLLHARQFHRCLQHAEKLLPRNNLQLQISIAKAYLETGQTEHAHTVLTADDFESYLQNDKENTNFSVDHTPNFTKKSSPLIESKKLLLLAQCHENLQNPDAALDCLKQALALDPFCAQAIQKISRKHLLTNLEAEKLVQNLNIEKNLSPKTTISRQKKATDFYNACKLNQAYRITKNLIQENCFNWDILPFHLSILVDIGGKSTELFRLSHTLMDACPEKSIAWYATGCYYYSINSLKNARHHFSRASELQADPYLCNASWLAYGHCFAKEFEHDPALAAYIHASQLLPNVHLPLLYVGIQHLSNNNFKLAEQYFQLAAEKSLDENGNYDPFVMSEQAYACFLQEEYDKAEEYSIRALQLIDNPYTADTKWANILINLGHIYRKMEKWMKAEQCFEKAILICPGEMVNLHNCVGLMKLHLGEYEKAIHHFEKVLNIDPKNEQAKELLPDAIELWSLETDHISNLPLLVGPALGNLELLEKEEENLDIEEIMSFVEERKKSVDSESSKDISPLPPVEKVNDSMDNMQLETSSSSSC